MSNPFLKRLTESKRPLILDGPMGTELAKRGFDVDRTGWSARALVEAPELVSRIHRDYAAAGAELVTANTFRTHAVNLEEWGKGQRSAELTYDAVQLAREAVGDSVFVCGSISPVGDSYQPRNEFGEQDESDWLHAQHARMIDHLLVAGVDALLVETQTTWQELETIVALAQNTRKPLLVSVVSFDGKTMLDGTPLEQVGELAKSHRISAIGCNCLPVEVAGDVLERLQSWDGPKLVYANSGKRNESGEWEETAGADTEQHLKLAEGWIPRGVKILGGCCGTSVELIAKFSERFAGS